MSKRRGTADEQMVALLQYLLVLELWRSGLSQDQIRTRLGLGMNTVNDLLKGIPRGSGRKQQN
jgi:hypothetical protein